MFIKPIFDRPKSVSFMWPMEVMSKLQEKTDALQRRCLLLGRPGQDQSDPKTSGPGAMTQNQVFGHQTPQPHSALSSWLGSVPLPSLPKPKPILPQT